MKIHNLVKAIRDQPLIEWRNGNAFGIFSQRSHFTSSGTRKRTLFNKGDADRVAELMMKRCPDAVFASYKCIFCDGYHVGRNR